MFFMGKYDDLKNASDESLLTKEKNRKKAEAESQERYKAALSLSHGPVLNELREIGRTFLGGRFLLRSGYRVEHFRAKDGSLTYLWILQYLNEHGHYFTSVDVRMSHTYPGNISFYLRESALEWPSIEKVAGEQVIVRLKLFLEELESKISAKLGRKS